MAVQEINLNSHVPEVYRDYLIDYLEDSFSEYVMKGGRGSVKSSVAGLMVVLKVINGEGNALCIRRHKITLRDSCYADIQVTIERLNLNEEFSAKLSPMEITHIPTGLTIYFRGLDDPTKIKSIRPKKGNFVVLWVEEANEVEGKAKIRNVQQSVGRGLGGRLSTIITYNPDESPDNWANKAYEYNKDEDIAVLHTTYLQVPKEWLGELFIKNALKLKETDLDAYRNEYLGEIVTSKGTIFKNVKPLKSGMEFDRSRLYRGIDFGYSDDPTSYTVWAYDKKLHAIYLAFEFYGHGVSLEELAEEVLKEHQEVMKSWSKRTSFALRVYCDNSEPRSRDTLRKLGVRGAESCTKGPDSVRHGIKWLQGLTGIYIPEDTNTYREFKGYTKPKNKNGEYLNVYPDKDNHTIDSTRYGLQDVINGIA